MRKKPLWLEATVERLRHLLGKDIDEDEQKRRFYRILLHIGWLPSGVRGAVLRELGSSLRQEQSGYARGYAQILRHLIKACLSGSLPLMMPGGSNHRCRDFYTWELRRGQPIQERS